ncbi:MAG: bifunctional oligoribonuclease/PAP phosphatase NrnA [Clostridia bacterium]|nr:bifunctional oligoribonuclease/PAP phosphatase NrnA [Clostridia bacterium]
MKTPEMQIILDKIKEYDSIIIFRHKRPDGDATGSTKGLQRILKLTYPEKQVLLINSDYADYMAFLGGEDADVADEVYAKSLGIVLDTATADRISNQKYSLCREVVKMDHHIPVESYGNYEWVEEHRSSACEMVATFYLAFKDELVIDSEAATYIYTGMVTDSGRFRYREVSGETMRAAGALLDVGIDTDSLFANLYMKDYHTFKFEAYVLENMQISENGVAYIYVDKKMQEMFSLTQEEASAVVSHLDSIKGSLIWLAFIDNSDDSIRVRLRSRFVTISEIANNYHGGGHACAAGATVYSEAEMQQLIADCDARLKEYKETHEGWL